jgi:multidrug resistance efflux pump
VIAFLTLCYSAIVWVIFFKLQWLPWNRGSQGAVAGIGIVSILALVIGMNLWQPYSQDVRVYRMVIPISPRVTGRVIEVGVQANATVQKGDLLFRVDPDPFRYAVDRLEADLKLKKIVLEDARALTGAKVAAEIKLDRAQAEYDQTRALLADARWSLKEATVEAPADGIVTNLSLRPGQVASMMASLPVMSLIQHGEPAVIATFPQSALAFVQVGDRAELVLERLPGQVIEGRVEAIIPGTGQGQLVASGVLEEWTESPVAGRFALRLALDEEKGELDELPAGAAGVAAIYTDRGTAIQIIRKVVMRMTTWLNYVIL